MTKLILSMIALTLICLPWSEASAQTQRDMNEDAATIFKEADKKLNSLYQKILKDYADDPVFRDAQLKMKYPDREPGYYGGIQPMLETRYLTELTKDRIKALQVWIDGVQEGDLSGGTVRVKQ